MRTSVSVVVIAVVTLSSFAIGAFLCVAIAIATHNFGAASFLGVLPLVGVAFWARGVWTSRTPKPPRSTPRIPDDLTWREEQDLIRLYGTPRREAHDTERDIAAH